MKRPRWKTWLFNLFQEFMAAREQSHVWTARRCPCCKAPAATPDAHFCAACGWPLDAKGTPTTELLPIAPRTTPPQTSHPTGYLIQQVNEAMRDGCSVHTSVVRATTQPKGQP